MAVSQRRVLLYCMAGARVVGNRDEISLQLRSVIDEKGAVSVTAAGPIHGARLLAELLAVI